MKHLVLTLKQLNLVIYEKKYRELKDVGEPPKKRTRKRTEQGAIRLNNIRTVENKIIQVSESKTNLD